MIQTRIGRSSQSQSYDTLTETVKRLRHACCGNDIFSENRHHASVMQVTQLAGTGMPPLKLSQMNSTSLSG